MHSPTDYRQKCRLSVGMLYIIDTAYMYGNEEEVGRAVRQAVLCQAKRHTS